MGAMLLTLGHVLIPKIPIAILVLCESQDPRLVGYRRDLECGVLDSTKNSSFEDFRNLNPKPNPIHNPSMGVTTVTRLSGGQCAWRGRQKVDGFGVQTASLQGSGFTKTGAKSAPNIGASGSRV